MRLTRHTDYAIRVLLYLVIGILLGVDMTQANVGGALLILVLTIICFSSK